MGRLLEAVPSRIGSRDGDRALIDSLKTVAVDGTVAEDENSYGGALTATSPTGASGCTTGFGVKSGSTTGVVTAGHCNSGRWCNMGSDICEMDYMGQRKGWWGGFQWHTTPHLEYYDLIGCTSHALLGDEYVCVLL